MTGRLPAKSLSGPLQKIFANPCLKTKSVTPEVPVKASDFVNVLHARFSSGRATGAERCRPGGRSRHPTAQRVLEAEAQIPPEEEHHHHIWGLQGEPAAQPASAPPQPLISSSEFHPAGVRLHPLTYEGLFVVFRLCSLSC